jgi:anthranilate 1,2-dioxygenase ferredoxin reductase component
VIGGGFIGLEVAAAAATQGCCVTLFEAAERLLARVAPAPVAGFVRQLHETHGNRIVAGSEIRRCLSDSDRVGIELADGEIHWADVIVTGIGIIPNVELAVAAGLDVDDGIMVDERCHSSVPGIFAAGEVTRHPIAGFPGLHRIESWKTASEQPRVAAQAMLGMTAEYSELPWAWSDQFDMNLQVLGFPNLAVEYRLDGNYTGQRWCLRGLDATGKIVAAFAVNEGRTISRLRRRFREPARDPQLLAGE